MEDLKHATPASGGIFPRKNGTELFLGKFMTVETVGDIGQGGKIRTCDLLLLNLTHELYVVMTRLEYHLKKIN